MNQLLKLTVFIFLIFFQHDVTGDSQSLLSQLKKKESHWQPRVLETYSNGAPKETIYYDSKDAPVKWVEYYEKGTVKSESNLCVTENRIGPDGPRVTYTPSAKIEKVEFYVQGKREGDSQIFFEHGASKTLLPYRNNQLEGVYTLRHENNLIAEKGTYAKGAKHTACEGYHQNGNRAFRQNYTNGLLNGEIVQWYENDVVESTLTYIQGLLHDHQGNPALIRHFPDRMVCEQQHFHMGLPHGTHITYYPSGQKKSHTHYHHGKKQGIEQFFFEDGSLCGEGKYTPSGEPVGLHYRKHSNGTVAYKAAYDDNSSLIETIKEYDPEGNLCCDYYLLNQEYHGPYHDYYPDGQVKRNYHYQQGEFEGEQKEYFSSGKPKLQVHYRQAKRDGLFKQWHENGQILIDAHYKNGKKHGTYRSWHPNGAAQLETAYDMESVLSTSKEWYGNGKLKKIEERQNGQKHGKQQAWNEDDVLIFQLAYANDFPHGELKEWHANGKLKRHAAYKHGTPLDKEETFHPNQQIEGVKTYVDGKLHGKVQSWFEDGTLHMEFHYEHGQPIGTHREYFPNTLDSSSSQLATLHRYQNGKKHGEQITYYPNGQRRTTTNFDQGLMHGVKNQWDREGNLIEEAHYEQGYLTGVHFQRLENGIKTFISYQENLRHELFKEYYPPHEIYGDVKYVEVMYQRGFFEGELAIFNQVGIKIDSIPYSQGRKHGTALKFNEEGRIFFSSPFVMDQREGWTYEYYPNGAILSKVCYCNDKKEGEEISYFENSSPHTLNTYHLGVLDGRCCEWNEKGIKLFEGHYVQGKRHGHFDKYDDEGNSVVAQIYEQDRLIEKWKKTP